MPYFCVVELAILGGGDVRTYAFIEPHVTIKQIVQNVY